MGGRSDGGDVAIVGRRAELDEIDRFLAREGLAAAVLLDGDAGIGKDDDLARATRVKAVVGC